MATMKREPQLRFPEFSGEWKLEKLEDTTSLIKDGTHTTHKDVVSNFYLLSAKNIKKGKIIISSDERTISEFEFKSIYKNYELRENDILMTIVGTIGELAVIKDVKNIAFQRSVAILRFENQVVDFVFQYLNNDSFQKQLLRNQVVSVQSGIYLNDLKRLKISTPSLPEQQKIADCLTAMDESIDSQQQKVEQLKAYKKGLLQQIFSQSLRFPGFEEQWEEKKLGECVNILSKRNRDLKVNLVLSVSNSKGFIQQSEQFEDRNVASNDVSNYKIVNKGQFAFNPARINVGSIARLKNFEEGIISPMYICFEVIQNVLTPSFVEMFIQTNQFDLEVKKKLEGSVRQTLSVDSLNLIKVSSPAIQEQQKIADCLSTLDELIELESRKLEQLRQYKKGLLQQLFV